MPHEASAPAAPAATEELHSAGEIEMHQVGQRLHVEEIYRQPVLCPNGCHADECITELVDGDIVKIIGVPAHLQGRHGLAPEILAVRVGGWNDPGFQEYDGFTAVGPRFSYRDLLYCDRGECPEIEVRRVRDVDSEDVGC